LYLASSDWALHAPWLQAVGCTLLWEALEDHCRFRNEITDEITDRITDEITDQIADKRGPVNVAVVSPDAGGVKRAALFRDRLSQALGRPVSMGFVEKYRSEGELSGELLVGDVKGRQVLLFDDLISSGQTLLRAAAACRAHDAASVWAAAAHGLFNANALQRLGAGPIDRIFVSDSVAIAGLENTSLETKLDVVSCAAMLGEAIRRSHEGGSIVELMQS
jgi:ribose-phosphate pyrophosphokinase